MLAARQAGGPLFATHNSLFSILTATEYLDELGWSYTLYSLVCWYFVYRWMLQCVMQWDWNFLSLWLSRQAVYRVLIGWLCSYFMFVWLCIIKNLFIIKPTRCINFTNLFWHESQHVSDSSYVHHQEFIHCTLSNDMSYRFVDGSPAEKLSTNLYDIYHCWVYSE